MTEDAGWVPYGVPRGMGVDHAHYANAPIVEAILEFRVGESAKAPDLLKTFHETLEGWADAIVAPLFSQMIEFGQEGESTVHSQAGGYAVTRSDGQRRLTLMADRFAFSWLGPYETWDALVGEAIPTWRSYCEVMAPTELTRLGCRFVNVIRLSSPRVEVRDYLRTAVDLSPYLPQEMESFFMQATINLGDNITTTVISAPATVDDGLLGVALDLDTYDASTLDLEAEWAAAAIDGKLGLLRRAKNYVFEASITDATRGLIR